MFKSVPRTLFLTATAVGLVGLGGITMMPAAVTAQDAEYEYEPDEGYHEEEWYDPTDWFNDDYRTSYERDFEWSDEGWDDDRYAPAYDRDDYTYADVGYHDRAYLDDYYNDPYDYDFYTTDWYDDGNGFDAWYDGWQ